jgi:GR25 family glycosyltransferase involved in LPS biosynthesis
MTQFNTPVFMINNLSPIAFFAYNRPWHTEQTLSALICNELASDSIIYFFIDGPKPNANQEQIERQKQVADIIEKYRSYFKESFVEISPQNKGLANSVIYGITEVINKHEKVIVLEDDIVASSGFIQFLNDALQIYENEDKVAGISGFSFIESNGNPYFLRTGACWGWATWKRVWNTINFDIDYLLNNINTKEIIKDFNINGTYPYYEMLRQQKAGLVDSWAIRFYASYFLKNQLFLYPSKSMVFNIGFNEGTHYNSKRKKYTRNTRKLLAKQEIQKQEIEEDKGKKQELIRFLRRKKNINILYDFIKNFFKNRYA